MGVAMLVIPFLLTPPAYLYLQIKDSVFEDSNFEGKKGEVTNSETEVSHPFQIHKFGKDYIARVGRINSGKSNCQVKVEKYHPADFSVEIPPMQKQTVLVSLKPAFGRLKIKAFNGLKKDDPIPTNLELNVGSNQVIGNVASDNLIISHLSPGGHPIKGKAEGFYPVEKDAQVEEGKTNEVELELIPMLKDNELARIVLRWDKDPNDLDSHLLLPRIKTLNTWHIYYPHKHKKAILDNNLVAMLDVDDTTSYGPETVTIYDKLNGLYKYAIYHFAGSGSIGGTSKAKIKLYTHDDVREFFVPSTCEKKWWYVFDLNINGREVQILPKNECLPQMGWKTGQKESTGNQ
jgi:hypothetical protein